MLSLSVVSDTLRPHGLEPSRLLCAWNSPGENTGVGSHFLLQGIFPTQELNLGLLHCRQILYHLSHQGSLKSIIKKIRLGINGHVTKRIREAELEDLLSLTNEG